MALDLPTPGADAGTWGTKLNNALNGTGPGTLSATIAAQAAPKWQPNTAYAAGASVLSPSGDIVLAKVAFTSGASYNPANWDPVAAVQARRRFALRRFHDALAAGQLADMVHIGHSITEGTRATAYPQRWTDQLLTGLRTKMQPPGITGGAGYVPAGGTYLGMQPANWTFAGSTAVLTGHGLGLYARQMNAGSTATLVFTGTGIRLFGQGYSGGPTVTVTIDGVAQTSWNLNSATTDPGASITYSGLTAGSHTIVLSYPATGYLYGGMIQNGDSARGIRSWNGGHSGDQTTAPLGAQVTRTRAALTAMAPHLVTLEYAINEYINNTTPATFGTNLRQFIDEIRTAVLPQPSIVIVSDAQPIFSGTPANPWSAYKAQMVTVAAQKGVGLFDVATLPGLGLNGSGMDADQTHPNTAGHAAIGTAMRDYLLQDVMDVTA